MRWCSMLDHEIPHVGVTYNGTKSNAILVGMDFYVMRLLQILIVTHINKADVNILCQKKIDIEVTIVYALLL